jgi:hypothetical protein
MSETMNDKYLHLGRLIAAQCPPGFSEAKLEGDLDGDRAELGLSWITQNETRQEVSLQVPMPEIRLALEDIREAMAREAGGKNWRTFVVTLRQGGHFQLDVGY